MTPLALELFKDLYGEFSIRTPGNTESENRNYSRILRGVLHECKFFELTAVWPLVSSLSQKMAADYELHDRVDQRRAFLPARVTWIEYEMPSLRAWNEEIPREAMVNAYVSLSQEEIAKATHHYRIAFVFIGKEDSTHYAGRLRVSYETPQITPHRVWRVSDLGVLPLVHSGMKPLRKFEHKGPDGHKRTFDKPVASIQDFTAYAGLSLINSPRIIGQRLHYPHGRAEREALKKAKMVGKFPLRAWTEIVLEVRVNPKDVSDEPSKEAHLTGERCLHYCRTYLRVRHGMLEYVEGHWRGDPSLGMKRSRYRLEPEKE
jgi:hypothetical protein